MKPSPFDEICHVQHNGVWYVRLRLGWRKKVDGELCPLEVGEQERMISAVRAKGKGLSDDDARSRTTGRSSDL